MLVTAVGGVKQTGNSYIGGREHLPYRWERAPQVHAVQRGQPKMLHHLCGLSNKDCFVAVGNVGALVNKSNVGQSGTTEVRSLELKR
jgi:hypothetical protein